MTLRDKKTHISIDLLDGKQVLHVTGEDTGIAFGTYNLKEEYEKQKEPLRKIALMLSKKGWQQIAMDQFVTNIDTLRSTLYEHIFENDSIVRALYHGIRRQQNQPDLSLSFTMDKSFISLPIEFMRDLTPSYVAASVPVYKTITTRENSYSKRDELDFTKGVNILLISSSTSVGAVQKILIGNNPAETTANFTLEPLNQELDGANNEIDSIRRIIEHAKNENREIRIEKRIIHTDVLTYDTFLDQIEKNEYDIIHYNGHGYFDPSNPDRNFLFFWKEENKGGSVVAIDTRTLSAKLSKATRLKFFYLSCCQGAASMQGFETFHHTYLGLLDAIVSAGVPSALGMRWPISPDDSKNLACNFYQYLLHDSSSTIEESLCKARGDSLNHTDKSIWCSPVLIKQTSSH